MRKRAIDPEVDALYLRLNDAGIVDSEQVAPGAVLDDDSLGNVVGIEVLNASERIENPREVILSCYLP